MRRLLSFFVVVVSILSLVFLVGCGGKSQKINGAAEEESEVMSEASDAAKQELPTTYLVEAGDKLWTIAEKPQIYGNKYQWPLIYDANRDILDSYEKLDEGQKLIIPRNVSAVEIEAARERAMELGLPPGDKGAEVAESENYDEGQEEEVAGLKGGAVSAGEQESEEGSSEVADASGGAGAEGTTEEPTPVPVPKTTQKKGGFNPMALIVVLLLAGAGAIIFIFMKKKNKDEEEEEKDTATPNILE